MILSDSMIRRCIETNELQVWPRTKNQIQPSSIDLRLGREFVTMSYKTEVIDPLDSGLEDVVRFTLDPGDVLDLGVDVFMLGSTVETVKLPDWLAGRLEGKSSLGRIGLLTHATAGFIDPGFTGQITLELKNIANKPIRLYPGMRIAQMSLFKIDGRVEAPYGDWQLGSKYQNQQGPTPSRYYLNEAPDGR